MAAKVELESYVKNEHPHPQYLQHHVNSCDTSVKQTGFEKHRLVSDGFPQDLDRKDYCAADEKCINGPTESNVKTCTDTDIVPGILFCFRLRSYFYIPR